MFSRSDGADTVLCAFNLSDAPLKIDLPEGAWRLDHAAPFTAEIDAQALLLAPWQAAFATLTTHTEETPHG